MRGTVLTLTVVVLATLVSIAVAEFVVRIAAPQPPSWLGIYREHPVLPYALQSDVSHHIGTGETEWTVYADHGGLRVGASQPPVIPGAPLLLVLGDSFAFGHGVDFEQSFAGLLAADGSLRVANAALPGWGPVQYRRMLDFQLAEGRVPDRILLAIYVGNDFHDCVWERDAPVHNGILGDPGGLRSFVKRNSHLYRLVSKAFHTLVRPASDDRYGTMKQLARPSAWTQPPLATALPAFQKAIEEIAATAAARHIDLRAVVIPTHETVEARTRGVASTADWEPALPNEKAAAILTASGIPFVDVTDALAKSGAGPSYLPLDGHLTQLGNRIVAEAVTALLAKPPAPSAAR